MTSRGSAAAASGFAYERAVHARLQTLAWDGERVQLAPPAGANKSAPDIPILNKGGLRLEAKTKGASEGGGCTMSVRDGAFQLPDQPVLRSFLPPDLRVWDGRVPSCLMGNKDMETWLAEKPMFKGSYISVPSHAVADYYRAKGAHYIQIEGKGLYHTGEDVRGWGVPKFETTCRIRIRLKQHSGTSVPTDCQACFNFNSRVLPPSPHDFMDPTRLPPGFAPAVE